MKMNAFLSIPRILEVIDDTNIEKKNHCSGFRVLADLRSTHMSCFLGCQVVLSLPKSFRDTRLLFSFLFLSSIVYTLCSFVFVSGV